MTRLFIDEASPRDGRLTARRCHPIDRAAESATGLYSCSRRSRGRNG